MQPDGNAGMSMLLDLSSCYYPTLHSAESPEFHQKPLNRLAHLAKNINSKNKITQAILFGAASVSNQRAPKRSPLSIAQLTLLRMANGI
jgi:hypothetical protein